MERLAAVEKLADLSQEKATELQDISLLYRISRAMHSTLHLDELMHLVLSAATVEDGAGFERAMLFLVNERSGFLQGMLGVSRAEASAVLPSSKGLGAWDKPRVTKAVRSVQRQDPFCRQVCKQRLSLEQSEHPLVQAVLQERVVLVSDREQTTPSFADLKKLFSIGHCACAPLIGHGKVLGVLLVDSPGSSIEIAPERRRFLELFANQSAQAMENSLLMQRLEESYRHLGETQEQMIQGEKMAALGETAASVTHELRNPLVSVGGYANRLAGLMPPNSKAGEYSQIIVREVRRMEEMLGNILAFSKKQMLCLVDCHLVEILEEVLVLEAEALQRAEISLKKEVLDNLPPIQGDEQKLRQVMLNLVGNARQAMASGGTLTVRAYPATLRGEPAVALEVEDTGGGIEPSVMRNIFNPFFTTRQDGTGLGLSIVHRIIEHHHGDIEVQNGELGARFIIRLTVAQVEHKPMLPNWTRRS
jgi:signal transduction histidine kinase